MTTEGIKRILNLFKEDIDRLTYTVDGQPKQKKDFTTKIADNSISIIFTIDSKEQGLFDKFTLVGKDGTTYATKILNFKKEEDTVIIEFPVSFVLEEGV